MQTIINLLARVFFMSTPLILGAVGEVIAERTGMMITACEGIYLVGAWAGFIAAVFSGSMFVGFLCAMISGMIVAMLYGLTTIYMKQHQIVMGTAIAILMAGFCKYFYRVIFGIRTTPVKLDPMKTIPIPFLSGIPFIGPIIFNQNIITYLTYLLVPVVFFILFKTSWGISMRSCGENPAAADTAGENVRRIRFLAVAVGGCLGGIAGAYYSICNVGMYNSEIINGRGWIAFGICFLGNWNPAGAFLYGIVFGVSEALGTYVKALGISTLPSELFSTLPYFLVILLTACRKNLRVPAKLGTNYVNEN